LDTIIHTHFDTLFDLKDHPETQHFAGTIVYRKNIHYVRDGVHIVSTRLDLGLVEGISEVFVNGKSAGMRYFGRRIYDIGELLHEGDNELEIRVTTTLGNYLKTLTKEENPTTWIYMNHPKRDQALQPMGMIGKVKIEK
jgi:Glycosyl hydrolases family 2, sugar binding domain.